MSDSVLPIYSRGGVASSEVMVALYTTLVLRQSPFSGSGQGFLQLHLRGVLGSVLFKIALLCADRIDFMFGQQL